MQLSDASAPVQTTTHPFSINVSPVGTLTITTSTLPDGTTGTAYAATLAATNGSGTYTWSLAAGSTLPPGVILSSNGQLSGTPTTPGSYSFTIQVSDGTMTATRPLTILVSGTLVVTSTSPLAGGSVGTPYMDTLTASGGSGGYTWSLASGALPAGLRINANGTITGTPTAAGSFTFTVQVVDGSTPQQTATKMLTITVSGIGLPLMIATNALPPATPNATYMTTLRATGGTTPYSWSVSVGTLPAGLSLDAATGTISGTATVRGQASFTIKVTDASTPQQQASHAYILMVL